MANVILVVGDTGTGKSTAIQTLDSKETYIINCANKPLPFKGSGEIYKAGSNLSEIDSSTSILSVLETINTNAAAAHIKNLIIDDSGFIMSEIYFRKSAEKGYDKFTEIAKAYQSVLSKCKSMRANLNVAIMMHDEDMVSNGIIVGKKGKTVGKLVDDQYNPLSVVTIALFTEVSFDREGKPQYNFITNRCLRTGVIIPAKSPQGMFNSLQVPNDLSAVFKDAREFYGN
jgi:septin family protein